MEEMGVTQFEVESLMSAFNEGRSALRQGRSAINPANVKLYDFQRPDKLSKDHIRTLQMMHETFARLLSSSLSAYLRVPVHAQLGMVEQSNSDEYMGRIEGPTVLNLVSMRPLTGRVVLDFSAEVAFAILDRLLGGQGRSLDRSREVTDIELSLLESVATPFLSSLKEAWSNVVALEPAVEEVSLNPQFLQRALPNDSAVIFAFALRVQDTEGSMNIAIPYQTIEPVIDKLNVQVWFARGNTPPAGFGSRLRGRIERVQVPIRAELGRARVTVRELSDLQSGDVIHLDTPVNQDIDVYVGKERKFRGRAGVSGNNVAVQITQVHASTGIWGEAE